VFGGAVLGVVCGSLAAAPWSAWRVSLEEGLRHAAIGAVALLGVLWSLSHPADGGMTGKLWLAMAVVSMLSGLWLRRVTWSDQDKAARVQEKVSTILIAYGLACLTTSPFVIAAVGLACLAYWMHLQRDSAGLQPRSQMRTMLTEGVLLACVLLALSILIEGRGVLPF
jgi:undecaprenyl-diphosphatase